MTTLLLRLKEIQAEMPSLLDENHQEWTFSEALGQKDPFFYRPLTRDWRTINLEYNVLRAQLNQSIQHPHSQPLLKRQLMAALAYSEILERVNWLINNPQEQYKLSQEQAIYRQYLRSLGIRFYYSHKDPILTRLHPISDTIRQTTADTNWPRLLLVRIKRILDALVPVLKSMDNFRRMVLLIDNFANPVFAYLSWAFYIPRFFINLVNTLKNTVAHPWMEDYRKQLGWKNRLLVQWQKLWFELLNDGVWMAVGVINCFVLVGVLAPAAIYLTVFLYIFDIILAGIRASIELKHFSQISHDYEAMILSSADKDEQEELTTYKSFLQAHIDSEVKRLQISIATTTALFLGMCLSLPVLAIHPIIPLIGAIFIVCTCLTSFYLSKKVEQCKPKSQIPDYKDLPKFSIFHPAPDAATNTPHRSASMRDVFHANLPKTQFFHVSRSSPNLTEGLTEPTNNIGSAPQARHPERSEGSPNAGTMPNAGDPSLRSG